MSASQASALALPEPAERRVEAVRGVDRRRPRDVGPPNPVRDHALHLRLAVDGARLVTRAEVEHATLAAAPAAAAAEDLASAEGADEDQLVGRRNVEVL